MSWYLGAGANDGVHGRGADLRVEGRSRGGVGAVHRAGLSHAVGGFGVLVDTLNATVGAALGLRSSR